MSVDAAYAEVVRLTRREARNFAYGIMLLPRNKRRAIAAIYAFARRVDDIADGPLPDAEKKARLNELRAVLEAGDRSDPMLVALADARSRFPIPRRALDDLIDGGLQDTERRRYESFEELLGYCRRVAGAVGVACVAVYGRRRGARPGRRTGGGASEEPGDSSGDSAVRQRAETLGVALQLINIIRDVREDWELGRVYLPQDELRAYGVSEEDLAAGRVTPQWRALMAFHSTRARAYLDAGLMLLDSLDSRSAVCVSTFAGLYRATLARIEERGFDVFDGPLRLSPLTKLRIVGAGILR